MVKQTINCFYTRIIRGAPTVEGYPEEKRRRSSRRFDASPEKSQNARIRIEFKLKINFKFIEVIISEKIIAIRKKYEQICVRY